MVFLHDVHLAKAQGFELIYQQMNVQALFCLSAKRKALFRVLSVEHRSCVAAMGALCFSRMVPCGHALFICLKTPRQCKSDKQAIFQALEKIFNFL